MNTCSYSRFVLILVCGFGLCLLQAAENKKEKTGSYWKTYQGSKAPEGVDTLGRRFSTRVNDPGIAQHHYFGGRWETKANGLVGIQTPEDLRQISAAVLYCEMWGGHPGTAGKAVSINGRNRYEIPEVGTAAWQNTHQYAAIPIQVTDLVGDWNALQFSAENGGTFWGHYIVSPQLHLQLAETHPDRMELETEMQPKISAEALPDTETLRLSLSLPEAWEGRVAHVDYFGYYYGYDENGNLKQKDWHGLTKHLQPKDHLGRVEEAPFSLDWDLRMIPDQNDIRVKARIAFKHADNLYYETVDLGGLETPARPGIEVRLISISEHPPSMWVRDEAVQTRTMYVPVPVEWIEEARLYLITWDGGPGEVKEPYLLNGKAVEGIPLEGLHQTFSLQLPIDPERLVQGKNTFTIHSDTHHHGIEVLAPGPALMLRIHYPEPTP